ncbi:hypothetical protein NDU88_004142 [Pleurodeles waltl]|uniref:Uncharacterized protein n=1 Tax=Pleurodeles waltl TaxID=8319 RepID=A0AAV7WUZ6_PLEWA|nr:hypothetical protein NDU88_004142 [Pleurodeles waltl]
MSRGPLQKLLHRRPALGRLLHSTCPFLTGARQVTPPSSSRQARREKGAEKKKKNQQQQQPAAGDVTPCPQPPPSLPTVRACCAACLCASFRHWRVRRRGARRRASLGLLCAGEGSLPRPSLRHVIDCSCQVWRPKNTLIVQKESIWREDGAKLLLPQGVQLQVVDRRRMAAPPWKF